MNDSMTLVTRFLLDPRNYEAGAAAVASASQHATAAVDGLTSGIMGGLHFALRSVFSPLLALAGGAGLLSLAHSAVEAAISFDTTRRSLEAVTNSAERAKTIMDFADKLAGPTKFLAEDLANAALRLEAFRLNTERFLPVATSLAAVFGGSKESLLEYADALGEIASGRAGRGMMILERAGITKPDLEAKGVTFSKGGELTSSTTQALDAIQAVVMERYGKLAQSMADSPAAKLASVMDTITKAARVAGNAILTILMPAANEFGSFVGWLVSSGNLEKAVNGLSAMFSGKGFGDFLVEATAWLVATLKHVPDLVSAIGASFHALFSWLRENLIRIGMIFVGVWTFTEVMAGLRAVFGAIKALQAGEEALGVVAAVTQAILTDGASLIAMATIAGIAATGAAAIFGATVPKVGDIPALKPVEDVIGAIRKDKDKLVSDWKGSETKPEKPGDPPASDAVVAPLNTIANHAQRIARNTDKLAEVQDRILGGGGVGKGAADAVNIDKAIRGTGSAAYGGGDEADRIAALIREMVQRVSGGAIVAAQYQVRGGR